MNTLASDGVFSGSDSAQISLQRADLMYCLAQAFLPPPAGWSIRDWGQPLLEDLQEIGVQIGVDTEPVRQAIAMECERWTDLARQAPDEADDWLVEYARLFLVPPVPVALNAGIYLEGALGGTSTQMMRSCYEAAGVEPDERFRDLPDHVAMQIEFIARLLERAARGESEAADMAGEYCAEFVHAWAEPLQQACQQAAARFPAARVYAALVQLLRTLVHDPALG